MNEDLIFRLMKRAEIRRQITTRKSVQENKPDRISCLLEEAAMALSKNNVNDEITNLVLSKFKSGNSIEVERIEIRRKELVDILENWD